jgi:RNA polymerase sigma-70 factor (ECF subfamily)
VHVFDSEAIERLAEAFETVGTEQSRRLDHLHDCLQTLEGRSRRICDLRYRDDLKPAAIAAAVGMSANAVAQALHRIREQLRQCIERKSALVSG